jgi:hypothetical protein
MWQRESCLLEARRIVSACKHLERLKRIEARPSQEGKAAKMEDP